MPKINITHLVGRLQQRIEQLENGEAFEARDINALLTKEQQQELKDLWAEQQALRKKHRQPKTDAEKERIGWKTIRDVRLQVYRRALADAQNGLDDGVLELQRKSEIRAARVFMDAFSKAKSEDKNAWTQGNAALQRAGFSRMDGLGRATGSSRDKEVQKMEAKLLGNEDQK